MAEPQPAAAMIRLMARNNLWSNNRLHQACAALSEAQYRQARPSFFGSIHGTLNHILQVDRLYLDRLERRRPTPPPYGEEQCPDLASLSAAQDAADRRLIVLCDGWNDADLATTVSWVTRTRHGGETSNTISATLLHLFQHQIHHRGQVHDMLSQTDVSPPQLDEFFLEEDAERVARELAELGVG
ncbi:MAG: DinB family protein [Kiloniellales bacterium]